jgi:hypothetical protein
MLSLRRRDVTDLNHLARALMQTDGRLGTERLTVADREFAAGDRVVCLRNSNRLGVRNGTCGTVEEVDPAARTLTIATDRGPAVELSRSYLTAGNVRHAYALTGHAAQGLTVERSFVLGSGEARLQEWGYVALSRARKETRLYVTGTPHEHESHFHDVDQNDPLTRFGRALEESAVELLAVDQRPLPSGPRHKARPAIEYASPTPDDGTRRRLLERQRRALETTRHIAWRRLETAEQKLARCGRFQRRTRDRLRAEIELYHCSIQQTDTQLSETRAALERLPEAARRDRTSAVQERDLDPVGNAARVRHLGLER